MMGRLKSDQGQLFYEFRLGDAVPEDHMVRKIDTALDLSWLRSELAPHYSSMGRPSIDPELMIPRESEPQRIGITSSARP
jgi:transposase